MSQVKLGVCIVGIINNILEFVLIVELFEFIFVVERFFVFIPDMCFQLLKKLCFDIHQIFA